MTTFDPSRLTGCEQMEFPWMSSAEASPASRTALPASVAPEPTSATCGPSSPASFARLGRDGCWQKTCQGYVQANLDGSLEEYSETWPAQGMMRSGAAFPLPMLARPTSATASGSWPTPTADAGLDGIMSPEYAARFHRKGRSGSFLEAMAGRLWPTPSAQEAGQSPEFLASLVTKDGDPARPGERAYDPRTGKHVQRTLNRAVNLWPTPQAHDAAKGDASRVGRYGTLHGGRNLNDWAAKWPTPTAEDGESKGMSAKRLATRAPDNLATAVRFPSQSARDWRSGQGRSENGHTPQLPEMVSGQLNARFVEWLMGLPDNWTDVSGSSD